MESVTANREPGVSISALGIYSRAMVGGIGSIRKLLKEVGANGGLELPPLRSRLTFSIYLSSLFSKFENTKDGLPLVGSVLYPFAPVLTEAAKRQVERVRRGDLSTGAALGRFANNAAQLALMGSSRHGLPAVSKLAGRVDNDGLFVVVTPDAFYFDNGRREVANRAGSMTPDTPYERVAQISPDLLERVGLRDVNGLPEKLRYLGIGAVSLDLYHLNRMSQSGETSLPPLIRWLPKFNEAGLPVRQIGASISRYDMPPMTGRVAAERSAELGSALLMDRPCGQAYDEFVNLVDMVSEVQGRLPDAFNITGSLGGFSVNEMQTMAGNLKQIGS